MNSADIGPAVMEKGDVREDSVPVHSNCARITDYDSVEHVGFARITRTSCLSRRYTACAWLPRRSSFPSPAKMRTRSPEKRPTTAVNCDRPFIGRLPCTSCRSDASSQCCTGCRCCSAWSSRGFSFNDQNWNIPRHRSCYDLLLGDNGLWLLHDLGCSHDHALL